MASRFLSEGPTGRQRWRADVAILTMPLPAMRAVDYGDAISPEKARAFREAHYVTAAKVFLRCPRFWPHDGAAGTDSPLRRLYYTTPCPGKDGILLAAYTWGEEAEWWGDMPEAERLRVAQSLVLQIHPEAPASPCPGASKIWHMDEAAGSAVSMFLPGQISSLQALIDRPEGRLHFAGEHASDVHGWIEGAVRSGLRAANEVHARAVIGLG